MEFRPVCRKEDKPLVLAARGVYETRVKVIYAQYTAISRRAAKKRSKNLRKAAVRWQDRAEMIVATDFDIVHFRAQIRDRKERGVPFADLGEILNQLVARNEKARRELPGAENELREADKGND